MKSAKFKISTSFAWDLYYIFAFNPYYQIINVMMVLKRIVL